MSDQDPEPRYVSAILNDPEAGWDDQPDEKRAPENDPVEYLPVLRHHLHETLWVLNMALSQQQAFDLAESYRQDLTVPKESPLARHLERSHLVLSQYLGLLDEEDEDERVPAEE